MNRKFILSGLFVLLLHNAEAQNYYYSAQEIDSSGKAGYTLFSSKGVKIITKKHEWIWVNEWNWILCNDQKLWTVYNSSGNFLGIDSIQRIYSVWPSDTLIPMMKKGLWGYYNRAGRLHIKHRFDDATLFKNGKAAVIYKKKYYFINEKGDFLKEKYSKSTGYEFIDITKDVALTDFYNWPQEVVKKGDKTGLIDKKSGKMLIECIYDGIYSISPDNVVVQSGNKYGVVNFKGEIIIPVIYSMIYLFN